MKDCMASQQAMNSGMTKDQMKRACQDQMKNSAGH